MLNSEESDCLRAVLVRTRNPLNIGAAARAMSNFGFPHLRVVRPYDVAFREARSAVDAERVLAGAEEFTDVSAAVADCSLVVGTTDGRGRAPEQPLMRLDVAAEHVRDRLRMGQRVAVLFGSEKVGLSNRDLSYCNMLLQIPTRSEHPSMNLGQAVAVVLYELSGATETSRALRAVPEEPLANAGDRERLVELLAEVVRRSGPAKRSGPNRAGLPGKVDADEEKVRRLVHRLQPTQVAARELLGILRRILWKLNHSGDAPHIF